ncbi:hypothetical protein [Nonomuraea wenchangensis]|uniref:Uncharacterized protein n=1 Tax=Nonomuraea wenchangensis TaxID=568860 RepID=A0A1I0LU31_9ACTN|nr:hypothetical protein [Nonomuraea wenchangensis]SEU46848.1 hypothetical protein SAMN05421811_127159 [Nonomuraea wenchangensis]
MGEKTLFYRHNAQGQIWLIEDDHSRQVMDAFPNPLACAVVHELNNALQRGQLTSGTATYRAHDTTVLMTPAHGFGERPLPVDGLTREQAIALAVELHQAGQMGAYT